MAILASIKKRFIFFRRDFLAVENESSAPCPESSIYQKPKILISRPTECKLQGKPTFTRSYYLSPLRGFGNDASADYEATRWGDHFEMFRDANGDWRKTNGTEVVMRYYLLPIFHRYSGVM